MRISDWSSDVCSSDLYRNLWDPAMVLRDIVGAISRAKDEMVGPERYRELANAMQAEADALDEDARIAAAKCLEIADIYDLYEAALRKHGGELGRASGRERVRTYV